ncbi:pyocin knob domain-containing protein [Acinetobacter gyllenbergii]|uniref:pyocin knob domain-containing protein n=1 Tax=Acinetobacter gyllenbergii TaxID=134534 RepID=UPI0008068D69|nr:pyocin knob domain-containing protein [Acinetobacter gyllenbergii]OBY75261.1 tail fiber protein [Acinetobacter gyllenbergii]
MANLVFKFNWDHRPYPYNAAQGKRQFMLPFASGIPNLNPNLSQVQGAGTAAGGTLTTSVSDDTVGRVLRVGDFGFGKPLRNTDVGGADLNNITAVGFYGNDTFASATVALNFPETGVVGSLLVTSISGSNSYRSQVYISATSGRIWYRSTSDLATWSAWRRLVDASSIEYQRLVNNGFATNFMLTSAPLASFDNRGSFLGLQSTSANAGAAGDYPGTFAQYVIGLNVASTVEHAAHICIGTSSNYFGFRRRGYNGSYSPWYALRGEHNTTVDGSGFLKAASPVAKLFSDYIDLNMDAKKQPIKFEKLGVGDYLIKGSLGFAQEGWYIEVPKDANGNTIVAVVYETLENGDISVKTYKRKFDFDLAAVVADLENPLDIPLGRWIDIRLHEEPEPELEEIQLSDTPYDFQLTNLTEAVAAAMAGVEPPEVTDEPL